MGSWKDSIKVSDLGDHQKLEMTCKKCGRVRVVPKCEIPEEKHHLYLDEIEKKARCKARGCHGHMRLAMVRLYEMSGFVGGLA